LLDVSWPKLADPLSRPVLTQSSDAASTDRGTALSGKSGVTENIVRVGRRPVQRFEPIGTIGRWRRLLAGCVAVSGELHTVCLLSRYV
jgi:hypothetical protein